MLRYTLVNALVLASIVVTTWRVRRSLPRWPRKHTMMAMMTLTLVFDNILIAMETVYYPPSQMLGLRLGLAPIEDFAYTVVVVMLLPVLWEWKRKR